jgi:hypothetical protein
MKADLQVLFIAMELNTFTMFCLTCRIIINQYFHHENFACIVVDVF